MDNNKKPSEPSEAERWALKNVPTAQLVAELSDREGVEATIAEPYQDAEVKVTAPPLCSWSLINQFCDTGTSA